MKKEEIEYELEKLGFVIEHQKTYKVVGFIYADHIKLRVCVRRDDTFFTSIEPLIFAISFDELKKDFEQFNSIVEALSKHFTRKEI